MQLTALQHRLALRWKGQADDAAEDDIDGHEWTDRATAFENLFNGKTLTDTDKRELLEDIDYRITLLEYETEWPEARAELTSTRALRRKIENS